MCLFYSQLPLTPKTFEYFKPVCYFLPIEKILPVFLLDGLRFLFFCSFSKMCVAINYSFLLGTFLNSSVKTYLYFYLFFKRV